MILKEIIKKIIYRNKYNGETYIKYLRTIGCKIGDETKIYSPRNIIIDETRPWLIEIGNNVQITDGVRILTHGYDWSVLKVKYKEVLGSSGKVKIGNNVFIGVNTTILKGITIGDNIIIGANSLVNKDCIKEGVYGGNPIKYIMSLEDYYKKRKEKQIDEAIECGVEYYNTYKKYPEKEIFREFFWLFEEREQSLCEVFKEVMYLENNYDETYNNFKKCKPKFKNYEKFIEIIKNEVKNDKKNSK